MIDRDHPFPVVGIGASAGGLEAFQVLLRHLPERPGFAIVFVMHLDPSRESMLPSILGRATQMPVREARDGMPIERDHVYTIPASGIIGVSDGHLEVVPRSIDRAQQMPIDHLFRTLAATFREHAIGVVLSGGGSDGTLGLIEIQAEGGITFCQDDRSATQDSMPRNAIASGQVDKVLPPERIARELVDVVAREARAAPGGKQDEAALRRLFARMRLAFGIDFSLYKLTTILRRIRRRMALTGIDSLAEYVDLAEDSDEELQALHQDFLIRVTSFFRDPAVFDVVKEEVGPQLLADRPDDAPIRVWVAGCATGEEVYSLAITLLEVIEAAGSKAQIKVLATDISEAALERARSGMYVENIEMDVSPERLRRFFVKVNGHYQVTKAVRDCCVFARHNLTRDPPFSRIDLISCRNVLIYFSLGLQKRVMPIFHYALNPGGWLILGTSETIGTFSDLFDLKHEKHKIYAKKNTPAVPLHMDYDLSFLGRRPYPPPEAERSLVTPIEVQREADRVVLQRYGPAGVVVDEGWNILQFRGHTGAFLEPAPGLASLNLQRMARDGLLVELRRLLEQVRSEQTVARREGLLISDGEYLRSINLEVTRLRIPPTQLRCYLVLFEEAPLPGPALMPAPQDQAEAVRQLNEHHAHHLQQELDATREYLQSIIEQYEATNEELKSAHEEILSSNEELQSTNEELQTAKEEMQSANEELSTVNDELRHRNVELAKLNDDLTNLFTGVNIPIVMVGRDLRIRRMTPLAERVFNLRPIDVGRPISEIRPNLEIESIEDRIEEVVQTLNVREFEVPDRSGRWYTLRIQPYVTQDGKIDGASIVAFDIDPVRKSLQLVELARREAEAIIDAIPHPLALLDASKRVVRANPAFHDAVRSAPERVAGASVLRLADGELDEPEIRERLEGALAAEDEDLPEPLSVTVDGRPFRLQVHRIGDAGIAETPSLLLLLEEDLGRARITRSPRSDAP
jgi:two-component system, chemotaxis family, CheB/CheR fusion protein